MEATDCDERYRAQERGGSVETNRFVAAEAAGLVNRIHGYIGDLRQWTPQVRLSAVVCTPSMFAGLNKRERGQVIELLQGATHDGGVHIVDTPRDHTGMTLLKELSAQYKGWQVSVEEVEGEPKSFTAKKGAA